MGVFKSRYDASRRNRPSFRHWCAFHGTSSGGRSSNCFRQIRLQKEDNGAYAYGNDGIVIEINQYQTHRNKRRSSNNLGVDVLSGHFRVLLAVDGSLDQFWVSVNDMESMVSSSLVLR